MAEFGQSTITNIRLPNGSVVSLVDWTDKPLFSTIDLLSGFSDQEVEAFSYVVSDNVSSSSNVTTRRVATEGDTNVATPGGMAATEEMLVYNIKVEPFQLRAPDLTSSGNATLWDFEAEGLPVPEAQNLGILAASTLLRLEISQKIYAEAGFAYFNTGFGPFISTIGAANIRQTFANQGLPSAEAPRSFSIPHHIGGHEKYRVVLVNPTGAPVLFRYANGGLPQGPTDPRIAMRVRILLEGLYKRPVS
jgi:hypothetical protein